MKRDLFNVIVNSIRNFSTQESKTRFLIPVTNMHRLEVIWDDEFNNINVINLIRIPHNDYTEERGVYCRSCHINVFTDAQIKIMEDLIKDLTKSVQSDISKEFNQIFATGCSNFPNVI